MSADFDKPQVPWRWVTFNLFAIIILVCVVLMHCNDRENKDRVPDCFGCPN